MTDKLKARVAELENINKALDLNWGRAATFGCEKNKQLEAKTAQVEAWRDVANIGHHLLSHDASGEFTYVRYEKAWKKAQALDIEAAASETVTKYLTKSEVAFATNTTSAERRSMEDPEIGEKWEHFKGTIYQVVGFSMDTATNRKLITYREEVPDSPYWSRPADEWHTEMDRPGYKGPRFVRVDYIFCPIALSQQETRVIFEALESVRENLFDTLKGYPSDTEEFKEYTRQIHALDKVLDD